MSLYARYRRAIEGEALPLAMVDLDAFEANAERLIAPVRAAKKTLRIATKSLRSVELIRRVAAVGGESVHGLMAYAAGEAAYLVGEGFDDILIAYPTALARDAELVAEANRRGRVSLVADAPEHLEVASRAAVAARTTIAIVIDVDVAYRPLGDRVHLGVRRSRLRDPTAIADYAEKIRRTQGLSFGGLMAYEAQVAGLSDRSRGVRMMKRLSRPDVESHRAAVVAELSRRGVEIPLFNGGGSGSVDWSARDPSLSEVAAGSGFLDSHLFDGYDDLELRPAAFFALQATRRPSADYVVCRGGGFIASGASGPDRSPKPWLPEGLELTSTEGAGEVQTPLVVPRGVDVPIGAPVFFRHAKAGELAEHFNEYALVRGERILARAPTYRGMGKQF